MTDECTNRADQSTASAPRDRSGRRAGRWFAAAALLTLALVVHVSGPIGPGVSGQVQPTSTPIRLSRITPAAAPTATAAPTRAASLPTQEAIIIVIEEEEVDGDDEEVAAVDLEFAADDWEGGYFQGNAVWYGRPWTAVYGALSEFPSATLTFELEDAPAEPLVFTVTGLDDELAGTNPIALEVNGERVYEGDGPFASWDGNTANRGADADWTTVRVTLPAELFEEGENQIAILNLSPSGNFGLPPYILLGDATLTDQTAPASDD